MRASLIGASFLALAACSGSDDPSDPADPNDPNDPSDPSDPTDPVDHVARDYDEVASSIAASARIGDISAMLDMVIISHGGMPPDITYMGSDGAHFHRATGVRSGVTFDYLYHCNNDADVIVASCAPTVNHSHITAKWSGNVSGAMAMNGITAKTSWAVRDINAGVPRVGGTGSLDFTASLGSTNFVFSVDSTLDRVRYDANGVAPLSGKIDFAIMANRTRGNDKRDFTMLASLAFAGGQAATLTLDASKRYSVDLSTGVATKL